MTVDVVEAIEVDKYVVIIMDVIVIAASMVVDVVSEPTLKMIILLLYFLIYSTITISKLSKTSKYCHD